jgi:hypothetical protein
MDWNPENWLAPRRVETPDVVADVAKYIDPGFTSDVLGSLSPDCRQKLTVLAERLEFIDHLSRLSEMLQTHKTVKVTDTPVGTGAIKRTESYTIIFNGHNFAGFDFDADALIVYLLLTCIDTLKGQTKYESAFEWLKAKASIGGMTDWDALREEYEREYGLSKRFREALMADCCQSIRDKLAENLAVVKLDSQCVKDESAKAWDKRTNVQKLDRIVSELYSIRSKFTHTSFRFFSPEIPVANSSAVRDAVLVQRAGSPSLREMLINIVKDLAIKLLIAPHRD